MGHIPSIHPRPIEAPKTTSKMKTTSSMMTRRRKIAPYISSNLRSNMGPVSMKAICADKGMMPCMEAAMKASASEQRLSRMARSIISPSARKGAPVMLRKVDRSIYV